MAFLDSLDPVTSLAFFRTMFESSADVVLVLDNELILDCNSTAEFMFGRPRDAINNTSLLAFSPVGQPDGQVSAEQIRGLIAAALGGEPQSFEWILLRRDGTPFPSEITLNRVPGAEKSYLQASIRDITMRMMDEDELRVAYNKIKADEEELRRQYVALAEAEEMFRNPVEHSPVGVYLRQDGIIKYANPTLAGMFGYSREEIAGSRFEELVDPGSREKLASGKPRPHSGDGSSPILNLEFTGKRKDGSPVEVEIFESEMVYQDRPAFYGSLVDVSLKKTMEASIRGLMNATRDETVLTDNDGKILAVNEAFARSAGKPAADLIGCVIYELIQSGGISMRTADEMQKMDAGAPISFEEQSGDRWFDTTVYSIRDSQGIRGQVAIFRHDITSQKAAERDLLAANKQMNEEKERLALFVAALDNMRDCAVITRAMGEIIYVNATFEKKFACKLADVAGKKIKDLAHEENRFPLGDSYFFDYKDTEGQGLFLGKNSYGVKLPLTITGKAILFVNKRPSHFVFVLREKMA
jgi:PAS domain S-box-containing protein